MSGRPPLADWRNAVRDSNLDSTARLVAFVLSTYMNGRGFAYPSKLSLAAGAGFSTKHKGSSAVDGAVDRLEAAGFLLVERRRGRRGFSYLALIPGHGAGLDGAEIPVLNGRKSLAELVEIPVPDAGESVESERESVSRRAGARRQTHTRTYEEYDR